MASAVFNPYTILGVKEGAAQEEIKTAFRQKSKEHHPDKTESHESQEFILIKKAYDILTDKEKRDTFDIYGAVVDFPEEARKLAFVIFLDVASRCPKEDPLDAEITAFVKLTLIPKYEDEMKAVEERVDLLKSRIAGIVKKPEEDFITERCRKVLEEYDRAYKMAMLQRDLHKAALSLLQEYKFDLERIEQEKMNDLPSEIDLFDLRLNRGRRKNYYSPGNLTMDIKKKGEGQ